MAARRGKAGKSQSSQTSNGGNLGFEQKLWQAADKIRGHMDASEYKHVALGLIFLKYISDVFEVLYEDLKTRQDKDYTDPEDRDEYAAKNVFWVPKEARWPALQQNAKQPTIGKLIDDAMVAIERDICDALLPKLLAGELRPHEMQAQALEVMDG